MAAVTRHSLDSRAAVVAIIIVTARLLPVLVRVSAPGAARVFRRDGPAPRAAARGLGRQPSTFQHATLGGQGKAKPKEAAV
eukprot:scaffold161651_cov44-Prasinocladus_malaysianus.AAC.1